MSLERRGSVFKRLETDREFLARLPSFHDTWVSPNELTGETLDFYAWNLFKMQRKIIEVDG